MPRRNYVTQQQAADHFGVTARTIRNKIAEGIITGFRIPGSRAIRVDLDQIEGLMKVMPTAVRPKQPFGPRAKIVTVVEALSSQQAEKAEAVNDLVDSGVHNELVDRGDER